MQQQQLAPAPTSSSPFNSRPTRRDFFLLGERHRGADCWHHAACHADRGQLHSHRLPKQPSMWPGERGNAISPRSAAAIAEIGKARLSRPWLRQEGFQAGIICSFCCAIGCTEAKPCPPQGSGHLAMLEGCPSGIALYCCIILCRCCLHCCCRFLPAAGSVRHQPAWHSLRAQAPQWVCLPSLATDVKWKPRYTERVKSSAHM